MEPGGVSLWTPAQQIPDPAAQNVAHRRKATGVPRKAGNKERVVFPEQGLVSGNGVPGEVNEKVVVGGKHGIGVLLQQRTKGFPDGGAVLVPGHRRNNLFF